MGTCEFYYSYNIPLKKNFAHQSWFHLSNVLPFTRMSEAGIPAWRRMELWWLGILTRVGLKYADFVSAESRFSLSLLEHASHSNQIVSANGSDYELINTHGLRKASAAKNVAVVVGTYHHKNLMDSYKIYRYLREDNLPLRLAIFGDEESIPEEIIRDEQVDIFGIVAHEKVLAYLANSRFYINTSKVENSWNAAAEGVFLAQESFISEIPPHSELLEKCDKKVLNHLGTDAPILFVERGSVDTGKLETWENILKAITKYIEAANES